MADKEAEEDQIFYNVLPPEKSDGPMANTSGNAPLGRQSGGNPGNNIVETVPGAGVSVGSTTTSSANPPSRGGGIRGIIHNGSVKKILTGLTAVIFLAVVGFATYKIIDSRNQTEPIAAVEPQPEDTSNKQPDGVTTPNGWQQRYFSNEICQTVEVCGDASDPDRDGLANLDEQKMNTDPNNPDSGGGGIADGDKVHIFGGDPLKSKSKAGNYSDADYYVYGYDLATDQPFTPEKLQDIKDKIKQFGLHQPTIKTLGDAALTLYEFTDPNAVEEDPLAKLNIDQTAGGKLDRDTQRSATIKKIGSGLIKYLADHTSYPDTTDFSQMIQKVKPYITVATNYDDPINVDKYVYGYIPSNSNQEFTLTYYSETQNLLIKYKSQDAQANETKNTSSAADNQRRLDLDNIRIALLLYSSHHIDAQSTTQYVFPPVDKYKTALVPDYLTVLPKDPKTKKDYEYKVGDKFDTFTMKVPFDNPTAGTTGYLCNQEECANY